MFVGTINARVRQFLASQAAWFDGRRVVVGCSGNFTSEATLRAAGFCGEIHSNDVSLYSSMLGRLFSGKPVTYEVIDPAFEWLKPYLADDYMRVAVILVLQDMLKFEKADVSKNGLRYRREHHIRMWGNYSENFGSLVEQTVVRLVELVKAKSIVPTSFFSGDVFDHFKRFEQDPDAIFLCWLPTYEGGYERMYKRLGQIFRWDAPVYRLIDADARQLLFEWVKARAYLWYDDRVLDGELPVYMQQPRAKRTVYLYSNLPVSTAYVNQHVPMNLPKLPMATGELNITYDSRLQVRRLDNRVMLALKEAYMAKKVYYGVGNWAFGVYVDDRLIGAFDYKKDWKGGKFLSTVILYGGLAVPGTKYSRMSKLVWMAALSKDTGKLVRRLNEYPVDYVTTTIYTEHEHSMMMRGLMEKMREGFDGQNKKVLVYGSAWKDLTWKQTLHLWIQKHARAQESVLA